MKARDFKKEIKNAELKDVKKLLSQYMQGEVYFTDRQLQKLIELNDGHGGCNFKYKIKPNNEQNN